MKLARWKGVLGTLALAAVLVVPAWASPDTHSALPGTLNYVEGQASIGSETLNAKSIGSAELQTGQVLSTENGKAEILLTPGVFVRLADNSAVSMVSPDLTNTQLTLNKGEAMVEVDEIHPENDIRITENGVSTRLLKTGLYDFAAAQNQVRVFSGKAVVYDGDHAVTIKGGHELALNSGEKPKAQGFNKKEYEANDLYRWSSLRSDYLAEANVQTAQIYVADGWYGAGWFGAGWYWSPWFDAYTFLPADGFFYNPFGWGFYSPLWVYQAPYRGVPYYHHFENFRPGPVYRSGTAPTSMHGPGFHSGEVRSFGSGMRGFGPGPAIHSTGGVSGFRGGSMGFGGFHGALGGRG